MDGLKSGVTFIINEVFTVVNFVTMARLLLAILNKQSVVYINKTRNFNIKVGAGVRA